MLFRCQGVLFVGLAVDIFEGVATHVHLRNLADRPVPNHLAKQPDMGGGMTLVPHLGDHLVGQGSLAQGADLNRK